MLAHLATLAGQLARREGFVRIPDCHAHVQRRSLPVATASAEVTPRFVVIAQGHKRVQRGARTAELAPGSFSLTAAPATGRSAITRATPRAPYLAIGVVFDPALAAEVVGAAGAVPASWADAAPRSGALDAALYPPLLRLLEAPSRSRELALLRALAAAGHADALGRVAARACDPLIGRALGWLEAHLDAPLSIARLARAVGASESSLHHRFKRALGTTPVQHHKRLRLERARDLLAREAAPAEHIAHRLGYASAAQFTRDYRRAFATTPGRDARAARERIEME